MIEYDLVIGIAIVGVDAEHKWRKEGAAGTKSALFCAQPAFWLRRSGQPSRVELLLDNFASTRARNLFLDTPLHLAVM